MTKIWSLIGNLHTIMDITVETVPKSTRKTIERDKHDTSNTQTHDLSPFWLGTTNSGVN
jgi:hypothetical protein